MDRPVSRRTFIAAAAGLAGCASLGRRDDDDFLLHVGTYTEGTSSAGVYRFRMDDNSGALQALGPVDAGPNPSFLARRADGLLVVANEVDTWNGQRTGAVSAFAVDSRTGALTPRGRRSSGGTGPAYVSIDHSGRVALVANYGGGSVAALPIAADGTLGDPTSVVRHSGSGPNAERQEGPHAHCIIADPSNRWALATDLGIDRVMIYRLDPAGTLTPAPTPFVALPPGAGPRHLAFHPGGRYVYLANELDLTLGTFRWDSAAGTLERLQLAPIVPGLRSRDFTAADIHVAPSGRFLYATVRGDDSIGVHAIDDRTGMLAYVQRVSTEGKWPRNFALEPRGKFLYVANQHTDDITIFRVDRDTGRLTFTGQRVPVPSPVCIRF